MVESRRRSDGTGDGRKYFLGILTPEWITPHRDAAGWKWKACAPPQTVILSLRRISLIPLLAKEGLGEVIRKDHPSQPPLRAPKNELPSIVEAGFGGVAY